MKGLRFCITVFAGTMVIAVGLGLMNYFIDSFGLFHDARGRSISIYSDERTSKYLLAHNYVPTNFDAYIIGPSLSANLNPKPLTGYRIYNLSMLGANITEEKAVVLKAMEKSTPKFVILCLHPYLTADHGMKSAMINPREYYGALGSVSLYKSYLLEFIRNRNLMPSRFPADQYNEYGSNHYNKLLQKMPVEDRIKQELAEESAIHADIDSVAWQEFNGLVDEFIKRKVEVIAYFHPLPFPIFDKYRAPLETYQAKVSDALKGKAFVIDFNSAKYEFFTKDFTNYIDHGHLSDQGENYLLKEILRLSHPSGQN